MIDDVAAAAAAVLRNAGRAGRSHLLHPKINSKNVRARAVAVGISRCPSERGSSVSHSLWVPRKSGAAEWLTAGWLGDHRSSDSLRSTVKPPLLLFGRRLVAWICCRP